MLHRSSLFASVLASVVLPAFAAAAPQDAATATPAAPVAIEVRVDPRVELFALLFRLAGNPEYGDRRHAAYVAELERRFGDMADHPAVLAARRLRAERGISYDAVMSLAIHASDPPELVPRGLLADSALEGRWRPDDAHAFLALARRFARDGDFAGFVAGQRELYELAEDRMRRLLAEQVDAGWFERFFGEGPQARFTVVLGLALGPGNYGPKFRAEDGSEELYAILGTWLFDGDGKPVYDGSVTGTLAHEFGHSFVNHLVYAHEGELREAGEALFRLVEPRMRSQAYTNWQTMLHESVVRACVARYQLAARGANAAALELEEQRRRGFLWTAGLYELLGRYEAERERYPTLAAFFPEIVSHFTTLPPVVTRLVESEEAARPRLLAATPPDGAAGVSPALDRLVFEFDRPMRRDRHAVLYGPRGADHFPELVAASFDDAGRVFTMQVKLKPAWSYEFSLNGPDGGAFQSADGRSLAMVPIRFETAAER